MLVLNVRVILYEGKKWFNGIGKISLIIIVSSGSNDLTRKCRVIMCNLGKVNAISDHYASRNVGYLAIAKERKVNQMVISTYS